MKIEEYISDLLFEHDCVIVPDFGGFVCNYAPAAIDPVKHLFEPPAKRILFNKGLTRNDGLLAHHISAKMKMPYTEALKYIAGEVKRFKEDIEKDKRLPLDNIGLLYMDEKGSLLFQQDTKLNYLADSYGLSAFYHLPVSAGNEAKVIPIYGERKKIRPYAVAAAIAVLVASAFYFTVFEKPSNLRFSSLDIFSKREASQYAFSPSIYKELPKPVAEEAVILPPTTVSVPASTTTTPAISTKVAVPVTASSFYSVIVGSFSIKENADNLVAQLVKQNIYASIVGKTPQGLYMVGYGKYASHDAAAIERDNLRKGIFKDAWVVAK